MTSDYRRIDVPGVRSLCWAGDDLVDWVGGGTVIRGDGTVEGPYVRYAYRFDAVETSPCGGFAVIYERRGTKGLVLGNGKVLREINRSFYHAGAYEYPIAIFRNRSGQTVLAHCPREYCQLELEDIETGETCGHAKDRDPTDFFHSRLRVSKDGKWLLSAGWVWHPWGCLALFDIEEALRDASTLDRSLMTPDIDGEVSAAAFLPDNRIVIATSDDSLDGDEADADSIGPNTLAVFDPQNRHVSSLCGIDAPVGRLMAVDESTVVGFYEHPKLYSLGTGEVLQEWEEIDSGNQLSSIIVSDDVRIPPIACDSANGRFAVASESAVFVVTVRT